MGGLRWAAAVALAIGMAACGSGETTRVETPGPGDDGPADGGNAGDGGVVPIPDPPDVRGDFTFYGTAQGLSATVWDVSTDEGGNVYVAAGDAVFAKRRDDQAFRRFDAANAGLTENCHAEEHIANPNPPDAAFMCPIVSVGGIDAGRAAIGFRGVGTDGDFPHNADWAIESGGADVVQFDGERLARERQVLIAGWPLQFCDDYGVPGQTRGPCEGDRTWTHGRRKVRQVLRIAVNHRTGTVHEGDVWFAGTHGTFSLLAADFEARGMKDLTAQYPDMQTRRGVWEHDHPAISDGITGKFLTGESYAIAVDPLTGDPWAANQFRLAGKVGYGWRVDGSPERRGWDVAMWPPYVSADQIGSFFDVWPDAVPASFREFDAFDPRWEDDTSSLSFCDDGSLWVASGTKGLARLRIDRAAIRADPAVDPDVAVSVERIPLPAGMGNNAWAVACDADGSLWVGFGWGGFGRLASGHWQLPLEGMLDAPAHAINPVRSIQIDRWSSPRRVYFAHVPSVKLGPGGVTVYDGP